MIRSVALILIALSAGRARADVTLLGTATLPGTGTDKSGLTGRLADGTPAGRLGGLGSALAYTGVGDQYLMAADRGPKDGATDFPCRFHTVRIAVAPGRTPAVTATLTDTTLLRNAAGGLLFGGLTAFDRDRPFDLAVSRRLDPEGIRVGPAGTVYLSDEYGPYVLEFGRDGRLIRSLPVPARFRPARPGVEPADELPPRNTRGRHPNRGFEGLAISPDGSKLYALLQGPLLQDGALNAKNERIGVNCRLLEIDVASGRTREFVYPLDGPDTGASEILAVGGTEFLVLERDSRPGVEAKVKRVYRIDLAGATDVSAIDALPDTGLPAGVKAVKKKPFLDLLDPRFGLAGKGMPEKVEGLAFGPDLPDGRRLLLVSTDNDFVAAVPFHIYAFAMDRSSR